MELTLQVSLLVQLLSLLPTFTHGESLFAGAEEAVINATSTTTACLNALKSDISCDSLLLQRISFASHPDGRSINPVTDRHVTDNGDE
jgi:hypothetical protein